MEEIGEIFRDRPSPMEAERGLIPMTVITWWMPVGVSEPLNKGRRPAVLKAIIREAVQHGCCTMSTLDLADVPMCNSSTVRSVIKFAIEAGPIIATDGPLTRGPPRLNYPRGYAPPNHEAR